VRYHYILTLAFQPRGLGPAVSETYSGTIDAGPDSTRTAAFGTIHDGCAAQFRSTTGVTGDPVVLFFALEPDQLHPHR
jgi:hypothetical protein